MAKQKQAIIDRSGQYASDQELEANVKRKYIPASTSVISLETESMFLDTSIHLQVAVYDYEYVQNAEGEDYFDLTF